MYTYFPITPTGVKCNKYITTLGGFFMKELLNSIATNLKIWDVVEEKLEKTSGNNAPFKMNTIHFKDVSDEVKAKFVEELFDHLSQKSQEIEVGEIVEYHFNSRMINSNGTLMENSCNDNLTEVFSKLPKLPDGESYAFPTYTLFSFILTKRKKNKEFNFDPSFILI